MKKNLLIFIKNPKKGLVKTRLAATIGHDAALQIYMELLEITRNAAQNAHAERWVLYSDSIDENDAWDRRFFKKYRQNGQHLGERMSDAFRQAFEQGASRMLIIGSDCPYINAALLEQAFQQLEAADVVLGPAADGGYYLLGMRRYLPTVFDNIDWSTDRVRRQTLERIDESGANCTELPVLSDIDTYSDWERFLQTKNT